MTKLATILAERETAQQRMADLISARDTLDRAGVRVVAVESEMDRLRGVIAGTTGSIVLELSQGSVADNDAVCAYLDAQTALIYRATMQASQSQPSMMTAKTPLYGSAR